MSDTDVDMPSQSHGLYEVMEEIGASEEHRKTFREYAISIEIFQTIRLSLHGHQLYVKYCGSAFERTFLPDYKYDTDIIKCRTKYEVNLESWNVKSNHSLRLIKDKHTYPGYAKLQLVVNGQPVQFCDRTGLIDKETLSDFVNDIYVDADDSIDLDCMGRLCIKPFPDESRQGPAVVMKNEFGQHKIDDVKAFVCKVIPNYVNGWTKRQRRFGWPTEETVSQLSEMGCLLVGVGHEQSPEAHMEWRISFTQQERCLMSSLNPTQHKTYIILKLIKKEFLEQIFDKHVISSYHLKTCILHMVENTHASVWTEPNLENCVLNCLKIIIACVYNRFCPNFFMKDQNLFDRSSFRRKRSLLLQELKRLQGLGHTLFLHLRSNEIGTMLTEEGYRKHIFEAEMKKAFENLIVIASVTSSDILCGMEIMEAKTKSETGMCLLDYFQSIKTMPGYNDDEVKKSLSYVIPWIHLFTGRQLLNESLKCSTHIKSDFFVLKAFQHFREAYPTDLVQVKFVIATYYLITKRHEACLHIIKQIEYDMKTKAIPICFCGGSCHSNLRKSATLIANIDEMQHSDIVTHIAGCVVFLPTQELLTPVPLQLEMERSIGEETLKPTFKDWLSYAEVGANVYLYFLKYLVHNTVAERGEQIMALSSLQDAVENAFSHRETAYNLLGWVYIQENQLGYGIKCFMQSWQIRPNHNAAKLHMKELTGILKQVCHYWNKFK